MARSIDVPGIGHNAPIPLGARVGNLLCSSGIAGKDAATGQLAADPAQQVLHAFANLEKLLAAGGATLADVVKLTIYVKDDSQRAAHQRRMAALLSRPARPPRAAHPRLRHCSTAWCCSSNAWP